MKKLSLFLALLGFSFSFAQVGVAVKAHLLLPTSSSSWKDISNTISNTYHEEGKNRLGYNVGLSLKLPLLSSYFLMPEVYYAEFKNEFTEKNSNTQLEAKNKRIEVPVLLGMNLLDQYLGVYAGPVAVFNMNKDSWHNNFQEIQKKNFTMGYQFGAQIGIQKLIISGRYQGSFSKDQRKFINGVTGHEIEYDNSPNMLLLGLGYKF